MQSGAEGSGQGVAAEPRGGRGLHDRVRRSIRPAPGREAQVAPQGHLTCVAGEAVGAHGHVPPCAYVVFCECCLTFHSLNATARHACDHQQLFSLAFFTYWDVLSLASDTQRTIATHDRISVASARIPFVASLRFLAPGTCISREEELEGPIADPSGSVATRMSISRSVVFLAPGGGIAPGRGAHSHKDVEFGRQGLGLG